MIPPSAPAPERIVYGTTVTPEAARLLEDGLPGQALRIRGPYAVTDDDLAWATVLCCNQVPPERIRPHRDLRWLHVPAASLHAFLPLQSTRPDLRLTVTGPINARAVAEHGIALLLALLRGLPAMIDAKHDARWVREPLLALQPLLVAGSDAHVLGYGPVAQSLIALLSALGARVTVYRREAGGAAPHVDRFCALADLPDEVSAADALFGVLPDLPATRRLVDARVLSRMKRGAVLLNLGRGNLVDHAALVDALTSGQLGGAALDVFDLEPLPSDSPLWSAPRLIISPHVAGQFRGNLRAGVEIFLREFRAYRSEREA